MTTLEELLQKEDTAWLAFVDAFAGIPEDRRDVEGVVPGWTVHDMVWHCGYWAGYVGDVLERMHRGEPAAEDQDWDAFNRDVIEVGRGMLWDDVIVQSEQNRVRARAALTALEQPSDAAVEEFAGETFDHYDEHAAELRAFGGG